MGKFDDSPFPLKRNSFQHFFGGGFAALCICVREQRNPLGGHGL
jgi:hypothetical protein